MQLITVISKTKYPIHAMGISRLTVVPLPNHGINIEYCRQSQAALCSMFRRPFPDLIRLLSKPFPSSDIFKSIWFLFLSRSMMIFLQLLYFAALLMASLKIRYTSLRLPTSSVVAAISMLIIKSKINIQRLQHFNGKFLHANDHFLQ